mmetsp:Transcript_28434/g.46084  ORF Transcript_28434/g.46084 Transcript_28434/m.46084 type:complete len:337 (-) Transcript_28434:284-1294(-)
MSSSEEERVNRQKVVDKVALVVQQIWQRAEVVVFGSFATNLFLPTSDIDLSIVGSDASTPVSAVRRLAAVLSNGSNSKWVTKMAVIDKARVPIVKFIDGPSQVSVDISFAADSGPQNVPVIKRFLQEFPALRPLVFVLKYFLFQRGLNEVYTGGIGSYLLFVLTTSMLQLLPALNDAPQGPLDLGTLLLSFFELYGRRFNFGTTGITVRDGGSYIPKSKQRLAEEHNSGPRPSILYAVDPLNQENDLGRGSFGLQGVRRAFEHAHRVLTQGLKEQDRSRGLLGKIIEIDKHILSRKSKRSLGEVSCKFPSPGKVKRHRHDALEHPFPSISVEHPFP